MFKKGFSKGDSTKWSYNMYTVTGIKHDIILSYRINYLPERYNGSLSGPTKLTLERNNQFTKQLNLIQYCENY